MTSINDLYTLPADRVDYAAVRDFVLLAEDINGLTESVSIELKSQRDGRNVVTAVQGLANSDGGIVLVGVSEEHLGEQRFVGIPASEHDAIAQQLHELLEGVSPEIIAVALPEQPDKRIIVVRIDGDAVHRPVVAGGRVMIRMPGQTVPARREDIIRLVHRNDNNDQPQWTGRGRQPMNDPGNTPLWPNRDPSLVTVKVHGGLRLPARVLAQPRFSTAVRTAASDALAQSALPDRIWTHPARSHELDAATNDWSVDEGTSTSLRFTAAGSTPRYPRDRPQVRGGAYIILAGRLLEMLVGIGVDASQSHPTSKISLTIEELHQALLAILLAQQSTLEAVARALDADHPSTSIPLQGWLQPRDNLRLGMMLTLDPWAPRTRDLPWASFGPHTISSTSTAELDAITREWLAILLLDSGAADFEPHLDELKTPEWA